MAMKRLFIVYVVLQAVVTMVYAQQQQGVVKTRGRMVNGVLQPGKGLAGATVYITGRQAVMSQGNNGKFSFPVSGQKYRVEKVVKKDYQLVDYGVCTEYKYSENPLRLVMEMPEQQQSDLLAAERKIRRNLQRQLEEREDAIEHLKNVSQQEKDSLLRILYQQQGDNEKLIADMAKRYSTLDYDQLDEFYRQVSWLIENGELTRADSLLRTRGDINVQVQGILKQGEALQEQKQQIEKAETVLQADIDEAARRCYGYYETFFAQHQNDSAAHYLELRASLDTTNVEWQTDAGNMLYQYVASYEKALAYYHRVLRCARNMTGKRQAELSAEAYNNIGNVYIQKGDYAIADSFYHQQLSVCLEIIPDDFTQLGDSYYGCGVANYRKGDYDHALEYLQKSREMFMQTPVMDKRKLAHIANVEGCVYSDKGDNDKALEYFLKSLDMLREILDEQHQDVAMAYLNTGRTYNVKKEFDKADEMFNKGLAIYLEVLGNRHPSVAITYINLGVAYFARKNYKLAEEYFHKSLETLHAVFGPVHPNVALVYQNLGAIYGEQGRLNESLECYEKALPIMIQIMGPEHPQVAMAYLGMGATCYMLGKYELSLEYLEKGLPIIKKIWGDDNFYVKDTVNSIEEVKAKLGKK